MDSISTSYNLAAKSSVLLGDLAAKSTVHLGQLDAKSTVHLGELAAVGDEHLLDLPRPAHQVMYEPHIQGLLEIKDTHRHRTLR